MINLLLSGAKGNMGKALCENIKNSTNFSLLYGIDKDNSDLYNRITLKPDVIIDFSTPKATFLALDYAIKNLVPIVIATTGFSFEEESKIKEFSEAIPIFKSSNMSYCMNIFSNIVSSFAKRLGNFDIEIIEKHHRNKVDAPSGTALMIADNINKVCNSKISFSSIRGGNLVGEHTVLFLGENESIGLTHTAYSRNIYVEGALKAAEFIVAKKNGLYCMKDI